MALIMRITAAPPGHGSSSGAAVSEGWVTRVASGRVIGPLLISEPDNLQESDTGECAEYE